MPKSSKFKSPINSVAGKKLAKTSGFRYLKLLFNESHFWINFSYNEIEKLEEKLRAEIDLEDFKIIKQYYETVTRKQHKQLLEHSDDKLTQLKSSTGRGNRTENADSKWVINISKHRLTETETKVLALGSKFAVSQKTIPKQKIVSEAEKGLRLLPASVANITRSKIVSVLNLTKKVPSNLTNEEKQALRNLSKNEEIIITHGDKGNCTVVLDKSDYDARINDLLTDSNTYAHLKSDLKGNIERKLNKFVYMLFTKNRISQQTYRYLQRTDSIAPRVYGLPKIHKTSFPFRPTVSFINSPLHNLSKCIAVLLTPLVGANGFTVKNFYEFAEQLKYLTINHDECMVSFDVISLFTKIPVDVAKTVVLERLKKDDTLDDRSGLTLTDIMTALNLCLDNTYLHFRGKFYRRIFVVAMGSPISVTIANLVMENVEEGAMSTFLNPPKI